MKWYFGKFFLYLILHINQFNNIIIYRLFNENGNYCPEELDILKKNATRLQDNASKQIADLVDKSQVRLLIHKNQIEGILTENCRL